MLEKIHILEIFWPRNGNNQHLEYILTIVFEFGPISCLLAYILI